MACHALNTTEWIVVQYLTRYVLSATIRFKYADNSCCTLISHPYSRDSFFINKAGIELLNKLWKPKTFLMMTTMMISQTRWIRFFPPSGIWDWRTKKRRRWFVGKKETETLVSFPLLWERMKKRNITFMKGEIVFFDIKQWSFSTLAASGNNKFLRADFLPLSFRRFFVLLAFTFAVKGEKEYHISPELSSSPNIISALFTAPDYVLLQSLCVCHIVWADEKVGRARKGLSWNESSLREREEKCWLEQTHSLTQRAKGRKVTLFQFGKDNKDEKSFWKSKHKTFFCVRCIYRLLFRPPKNFPYRSFIHPN